MRATPASAGSQRWWRRGIDRLPRSGAKKNWNQALFPSLKRRGGCAIKKMSRSNLSSRRRGGQLGEIFRPEEFRRTDHPSAALRRLRAFLLMPQPPLLFKEGNMLACNSFTRSDALGYDLDAASRLSLVRFLQSFDIKLLRFENRFGHSRYSLRIFVLKHLAQDAGNDLP